MTILSPLPYTSVQTMSFFQSICRRFSSEKIQLIIGEDVADLWPSTQQNGSPPTLAARRGVVGLAAKEEEEKEASEKDSSLTADESTSTDPIDLPALKRDSDGLMHDFMQRCVEIAVGQQIKEQALKNAREKLHAAVVYHNLLRQDYLTLCSAVARVSALRPWYRSEKYLAQTRIELEAQRGPVREEDFWTPPKTFFDDDPLHEKLGPFPTREVVTGWDDGTWSIRSFQLLPWDADKENMEPDASSSFDESSGEDSQDDGQSTKAGKEPSMTSLRSLLQNDLEAISNDEDDDDDEVDDDGEQNATPTGPTKEVHTPSAWPSPDLTKKDRKQIRRLCERHVDPRRASIETEERALLKARLRSSGDLLSHLWSQISHAQADHRLFKKDDISQVQLCTKLLQTITEIEIGWEVHKETTAAERTRAQMLVLRLQWDLNGSQRLRKDMEAKLGEKRQKQMDVWQDIVCAAALRGTPPAEETNIFGSVQWDVDGVEEEDHEVDILIRLPRGGVPVQCSKSPGAPEPHTELFGPMESDSSGIREFRESVNGSAMAKDGEPSRKESTVEELRTMRLDSGFAG